MKIGLLDKNCSNCNVIYFCNYSVGGYRICKDRRFNTIEEYKYVQIADQYELDYYYECIKCKSKNCYNCETADSRRFYENEQRAQKVDLLLTRLRESTKLFY